MPLQRKSVVWRLRGPFFFCEGGREGAVHFRRGDLVLPAAELWPSSGALLCGTIGAVVLRLVLRGSMLITRRSGVGTGAGASSVCDLIAQQSSLVLARQLCQAERSGSGYVCAKVIPVG